MLEDSNAKLRKRSKPRPTEEVDAALLESFVGYNLRRAAAKQRERFHAVFEPYDIRPVQLTVLTLILNNMPLRQSALGKALDIKRANVVTLLDELQARDLILRQPASDDRRAHELYLTASGRRLTKKLLAIHSNLENDLARTLGIEQLEELVALLRAFRAVESKPKLPRT